jgi:hypothetical protein
MPGRLELWLGSVMLCRVGRATRDRYFCATEAYDGNARLLSAPAEALLRLHSWEAFDA